MDWIQCPLSAYIRKRVCSLVPSVSIYTTAFKRLAVSTLLLGTLKKCAKIVGRGGILKLDLTRGVTAVLVTLHLAGCVLTGSEVQRLPFKGIIFRHRTSVFHTLGSEEESKGTMVCIPQTADMEALAFQCAVSGQRDRRTATLMGKEMLCLWDLFLGCRPS